MLTKQILGEGMATGKIIEIWKGIKEGANAYLKTQFKSIIIVIGFLGIIIFLSAEFVNVPLSISLGRAGAFLMGSFFSAMVGYLGMNMAVQGNIRVMQASRRSFKDALKIAYRSGTITGMLTDGLGLLGGTLIFIIYLKDSPEILLGFGFGGTLLALFMRVGGGVYTKAADVGADLVGKVEKSVPEDDPRNAAVVADLVGDNVGDCAGMAADIFESYEVTMVSAIILGLAIKPFDFKWIIFPLLARGIGVISTIVGTYAVTLWPERVTKGDAFRAMDLSYDVSSLISGACLFFLSMYYVNDMRVFFATAAGLVLAISFNKLADHFTSPYKGPVDHVAKSASSGAATGLLSGIALGFESTVWTTLVIAFSIVASALIFSGAGITFVMYGIALASIGMLTHTGNNVSMDTFGPIVDNANGIGEMAGLEGKPRKILADLDASGNTSKAVTKAIAIASAVLAAVSLFGAYAETIGLEKIGLNIVEPLVFVGLLVGGSIPFLFSSFSIRAVERGASKIIEEVRKQFKIPGIIEGKILPDYSKVIRICTESAQKELVNLALLAILAPVIVGLLLGEAALGGFLVGIIVTGQLLAVFMANSGGALDNAKKKIEDGFYGGKGSETHKAAVIGDTVGDPLKDTSGPALNPMIKVINLISLLFITMIVKLRHDISLSIPIASILLIVLAFAIWRSKKSI
jgi:K(+)-stimulated pyrophosphate-energized sodium pump